MYLKLDHHVGIDNFTRLSDYWILGFVILSLLIVFSSSQFLSAQSCISNDSTDKDGDDIPDKWEDKKVDLNHDEKIDLNLPAKNASSMHKDIFLEIDYMKWHQPYAQVIPDVIKAFHNAPVCNPDGNTGIKLHVQLDEEIPHKDLIKMWDDFDRIAEKYFGTPSERRDHNADGILDAKDKIYHYAIFGHTYDDTSTPESDSWSSGMSDQPGVDILVSLGSFTKDSKTGHPVGSPVQQEGTLMHELGHALGLDHGGKDDINCKPNYLSVMNYAFQFPNPLSERPLDYSRSSLMTLNESSLNESSGINQSTPPGLETVYGPGDARVTKTGIPINWNRDPDSNLNNTGVKADINYIANIRDCSESSNNTLKGFDDWSHLIYYPVTDSKSAMPIENFVGKFPSISSSLESHYSFPNETNNATSVRYHYHNQSKISNEMTSNDTRNLNLQLASSLNDAIGNLSNTSSQYGTNRSNSYPFYANDSNDVELAKSFYEYKIGNTSALASVLPEGLGNENNATISQYIQSGKIDNAISSLKALLPAMDSSIGGNQSNDKIVNSIDQQRIADQINNTIEVLKDQSCSYSNCTIVDKSPNATIEY